MNRQANIQLHKLIILKARQLPSASNKRLIIIHRAIEGIIRANQNDYNPIHI